MYAKYEEDFGLARNAMKIYDRGTTNIAAESLVDLFTVYIAKATQFFGLISTREIYQKSIEMLPDVHAKSMAVKFALMEVNFGEVDRARSILAYASQFCDPRVEQDFWVTWHEFEVKYGNEDTYKEMLRVKRSIQAKYNSEVNYITSQILAARQIEMETAPMPEDGGEPDNEGTRVVGFVRAQTTEPAKPVVKELNPDEIEIDESSDEEEKEEEVVEGVAKVAVPAAVFGTLANQVQEDENEKKLGAKDRFKRKRADE
jgi:pre-mRNA-splicing factor SYF1